RRARTCSAMRKASRTSSRSSSSTSETAPRSSPDTRPKRSRSADRSVSSATRARRAARPGACGPRWSSPAFARSASCPSRSPPRYIVNALRDWHALSALNEKPLLDALDDLVRAGAPKRELAALRSAIELQLGYEIFQTTDATKCDLSTVAAAILTYHHAEVDVDARITRGRFEHLIRPMLEETRTLVRRVTDDAGIAATDVAAVVYTGGSSAIPSFRARVRGLLPNAEVRVA